jgi:hypothetical protein
MRPPAGMPRFADDEALSDLPSARSSPIPDVRPLLKLIAAGDRLLDNLLQAGWIERSPEVKTRDLYRITEAGRAAFRAPVPIR